MHSEYTRLRVEQWVNDNVSPYCGSCKTNCCDASKHLINMKKEEPAVGLFSGAGVGVYRSKDLDVPSVKNWMRKGLSGKVLTRERKEVPKPSVIEANLPARLVGSKFREETDFVLYAENCPFYEKNKGCLVHWNPRRPQSCKEYPLTFEQEGDNMLISIHNSCPVTANSEIKARLSAEFQDAPVISISEVLRSQLMQQIKR